MVDAVNAILRQPQAFPGKIDIRRVEAAKANRLKQLQNWEEYDRSMRSLDAASESRKHSNRPRAVKFQQNYVLLDAALRDDIDEVRQLLEQNMDPNVCKDDGLTPLHQACINNSVEMCALLIQHGADVNCRDADLWTPLHAAATSGHTEVCEYLLEHGADLLATNVDGSIPYDIAEDEETSWFLHTQFKIRGLSPSDLETARSAPERRMLADIKRSYNNGESVTELDSQGAAPIHVAAACGFCEVTTMLLRMGVDPNSLDADSWTPAHVAVCWGQVEVLQILIAYGADLLIRTPEEQDAFDLCDSDELHEKVTEIWNDRETLKSALREGPNQAIPKPLQRRKSMSSVHRSSMRQKSDYSKREVIKETAIAQNSKGFFATGPLDDSPLDSDSPSSTRYDRYLRAHNNEDNYDDYIGRSQHDHKSRFTVTRPPTTYDTNSSLDETSSFNQSIADEERKTQFPKSRHSNRSEHTFNDQNNRQRGRQVQVVDKRGSLDARTRRPTPVVEPIGRNKNAQSTPHDVLSTASTNEEDRAVDGISEESTGVSACCRNCKIL